jgi:hypothetical protein
VAIKHVCHKVVVGTKELLTKWTFKFGEHACFGVSGGFVRWVEFHATLGRTLNDLVGAVSLEHVVVCGVDVVRDEPTVELTCELFIFLKNIDDVPGTLVLNHTIKVAVHVFRDQQSANAAGTLDVAHRADGVLLGVVQQLYDAASTKHVVTHCPVFEAASDVVLQRVDGIDYFDADRRNRQFATYRALIVVLQVGHHIGVE